MADFDNATTTNSSQTVHEPLYDGFLGILSSLGVIFNGLLLVVLWRNKTPEFRTGTSYIIGNLALADCLTGVAVLLYITYYDSLMDFQLSMVWTTIAASLLNLVALSMERTVAFSYPFTSSSTIVTVKRTIAVILLTWAISISCGVLVYYYTFPTQFSLIVVFEVSVLVFVVGQVFVFAKMQQRNREIILFSQDLPKFTRKAMRQSVNTHVTKVVLILILVVIVTVLPYMVVLQLIYWKKMKLRPALPEVVYERAITFNYYLYPVELINFVVNPIIYAWRLKRYRRGFIRAFPVLQCLQQSRNKSRPSSSATSLEGNVFGRKTQELPLTATNTEKTVC